MTATTGRAVPHDDDKLDAGVLKIAGVVVLGAVMAILDITVVNVAIPTFATVFQTTYTNAAWTMTAYTLALATVIPLTGWAADRFGTKRLYMGALLSFLLGSALCSTAWNIQSLITFRVIQGLGGGMLMPLGLTIMTHAAGPHRVGRVMAVLGVPMLLGPIGGPILGGWLIQDFSWHWIFLINVPIGIVALSLAAVILPRDAPEPSESFDFLGMLMLSPGLALFLFGVSSIPAEGTIAATRVIAPAFAGAVLITMFVWHAFRTTHPLIDLHLFQNRQLTIAIVAMFLFAVAFFGAALLTPSYFLEVRGQSTLDAGLLIAPQGLGAMCTMPVSGRLVDKIGPGRIVMTGIVLIAAGMATFTVIGAQTSYALIIPALFVMGLGLGATMMPTMTAALQTLTRQTTARGSTLTNIVQQIASAIGTAVMSTVLTYQIKNSAAGGAAVAAQLNPALRRRVPPGLLARGLDDAARAFAHTYIVSMVLIAVTFVVAMSLPRRRAVRADQTQASAAAAMH
jgi:EmrB/QacA subfamily drug resistance transporter